VIVDYQDGLSSADIEADLCIIGAGPAGIAIAQAFVGTSVNVCLIEGGGLVGEHASQALYEGSSIGPLPFDASTSRMRAFGGSCNLWGGGCVPLAELDLAARDWVPHSGWPISHAELQPHYRRAQRFCGIGEQAFEPHSFREPLPHAPIAFDEASGLVNRTFVSTPIIFGDAYRGELERAPNIRVLLHANLLELRTSPDASAVQGAAIGSISGRRSTVRARHYVLACGGLENARALLLSNAVAANGLGNDHDVVGRYFMDHPSSRLGAIFNASGDNASSNLVLRPYDRGLGESDIPTYPEITLSDEAQRARKLLNARAHAFTVERTVPRGLQALRQLRAAWRRTGSEPTVEERVCAALNHRPKTVQPSDASAAMLALRTGAGAADILRALVNKLNDRPTVESDHIDLVGFFEQAPNPHSRVMLCDDRDALGLRKICVDWRLTELDLHTYRVAAEMFGQAVARACGGRFEPEAWLRDGTAVPPMYTTAHHLGTTRMADDPKKGVVDRHGKVHGVANLHVAGSSVFPTGGWAFPTLTIVALSLRLAESLKARLHSEALAEVGDQANAA
jgi:choline dehydrogenase-like flavoprotein